MFIECKSRMSLLSVLNAICSKINSMTSFSLKTNIDVTSSFMIKMANKWPFRVTDHLTVTLHDVFVTIQQHQYKDTVS